MNNRQLGWKTILGGLLFGAGYACDAFGVDPSIGNGLRAVGGSFGVYGVRSAIAKVMG